MVRVPLEELVLQILLLGHGPPQQFLERVIEPPPARSVAAAVSELQAVGALSPQETLTPLGTLGLFFLNCSPAYFTLQMERIC